VVGVIPDLVAGWLPIRYEALQIIEWARPELVRDRRAMTDFLLGGRIRFAILPKGRPENDERVLAVEMTEAVAQLRARNRAFLRVDGKAYVLWEIASTPEKGT
jgi:hypothetical protein